MDMALLVSRVRLLSKLGELLEKGNGDTDEEEDDGVNTGAIVGCGMANADSSSSSSGFLGKHLLDDCLSTPLAIGRNLDWCGHRVVSCIITTTTTTTTTTSPPTFRSSVPGW